MKKAWLLKDGVVVTMNPQRQVVRGDVLIEDSRIAAIGPSLSAPNATSIALNGAFVIPGLIQAHTHLCQALFRGLADDLPLMAWLREKIWPFEHGHTAGSMRASALWGLLEMQKLGTTSILDMGSVRHTDVIFQAAEQSGIRFWGSKCLMDLKGASGPLFEDTQSSLDESQKLINKWHEKSPLLRYNIAPRFVLSCTEKLLKRSAKLSEDTGCLLHTHASESKEEVALVRKRSGLNNVDYLDKLGLLGPRSVVVHGVHLTPSEVKRLIKAESSLVHCPSANLKLGSGIAPIESYRQAGLKMGLGADGAPCNNTMDPFLEMRLAALLQKPRFGPDSMPAMAALELATVGGAALLGRSQDLGSLEKEKLADLVVVDRNHPSVFAVEDPYSALVYGCSGRDVRHVFTHGQWVVKDGSHQFLDEKEVLTMVAAERRRFAQ